MGKVKYGYMCSIAQECELEHTKVEIFHSYDALVKEFKCIEDPDEECHAVKVKIELCEE